MKSDLLYTYAVIADTHIEPENQADGTIPRSNGRTRNVVDCLNRFKPAFVVHLGDIVHPTPFEDKSSYEAGQAAAAALLSGLRCPLHLVPGNHDVGDKVNALMPDRSVRQNWLDKYNQVFGEQFYSFEHKEHYFIILNNCVFNSGLPIEEAQRVWFENELYGNIDKRIFIFLHYPIFIGHPEENSHYDNVDEPARSWFLGLIEKYNVEATFAGHVHFFFFNKFGKTNKYALPSTSRVRADYSGVFRVGPESEASEFGHNDVGKLGFFLVHVKKDGHVTEFVRTYGAGTKFLQTSGATAGHAIPAFDRGFTDRATLDLGVQIRQPLVEIVDLPLSPTDEFGRRTVHSDYPLLVIWDLSLRKLRIVASDLGNKHIRDRVRVLVETGCEITVFSLGLPDGEERATLQKNADLIGTLEINLPGDQIATSADALQEIKVSLGCRLTLAKIHISKGQVIRNGAKWALSSFGSGPFLDDKTKNSEFRDLRTLLSDGMLTSAVDGFVYRIRPDAGIMEAVSVLADMVKKCGLKTCTAAISLTPTQPMFGGMNEFEIANSVAEAFVAAYRFPEIDIFLDTFLDVERGYACRRGLVDQRYNFTISGHVLRHLQKIIDRTEDRVIWSDTHVDSAGKVILGRSDFDDWALILPASADMDMAMMDVLCRMSATVDKNTSVIDLSTGLSRNIGTGKKSPGNGRIRLTAPHLVTVRRIESTNSGWAPK